MIIPISLRSVKSSQGRVLARLRLDGGLGRRNPVSRGQGRATSRLDPVLNTSAPGPRGNEKTPASGHLKGLALASDNAQLSLEKRVLAPEGCTHFSYDNCLVI